ncbi:MAG: metallophosphoesterase family protein [Candidatus Omnitrophica bacterium]|nr:metallophosphoesterase family protein [Candidatus Omnitrophota bacterium]
MKRIGVVSDTHIPKTAPDMPEAVYEEFKNVDMILHAGDFVVIGLLEKLRALAPTRGVCGNMDTDEIRNVLPVKDIIKVDGFKIGLMHGYGSPTKLTSVLKDEFNKVDVIVFGHSHAPYNEKIKNTLFFNPGTPTDRIFAPYNTFGILEVGDEVKGRIIRI